MSRVMIYGLVGLGLFIGGSVEGADEVKSAPRYVSVTGASVARVQPDQVVWHVNVRRADKELAKAQAACEETVKKVLELRGELKLQPEDVQTGYLSISKVFDRDQQGNVTSFRHFQVDRSITIRQRDVNRFDQILSRLIAASDIEVSYTLETSKFHEVRTEARLEAVKAARKKATEMTELLGGKLGRVLRIVEPHDAPAFAQVLVSNSAFSAAREAAPDRTNGTFAPGAIEVRVAIDVIFEIE